MSVDTSVYYIGDKYVPWPGSVSGHRYRGAHWTFDAVEFGKQLQSVKSRDGSICSVDPKPRNTTMYMHGWDHALKDPSYNAIAIDAGVKVLIVEGLYLLLDVEPWKSALDGVIDLSILIECDEDEVRTVEYMCCLMLLYDIL